MKKLMFISLLFAIMSLMACQKDKDTDPNNGGNNTPTCTTGTVRFTCTSNNPYYLYIDGSYKTQINGNSFIEYELTEGQHTAKVEQVSGYLFYATVKETTLNVYGCNETEWVFP